jgi:primosomal protein N' (replication factor Y)
VTFVGPAPCPVERIRSRWRWHVLVKSGRAGALTRVARQFADYPAPARGQLRVIADRDPVSLL